MAKTNHRPVDRLERQQRLAARHLDSDDFDLNVRNWELQYNELDDEEHEQALDQAEAA